MATKDNEKRPTLRGVKYRLVRGAIAIFITLFISYAFIWYTQGGYGEYANLEVSLYILGRPKITHGGYFKLSYEGDVWTKDFGSGSMPTCTFRRIDLKRNKIAYVEVGLKNGFGVVMWTKEEWTLLSDGDNSCHISEIGEIK